MSSIRSDKFCLAQYNKCRIPCQELYNQLFLLDRPDNASSEKNYCLKDCTFMYRDCYDGKKPS